MKAKTTTMSDTRTPTRLALLLVVMLPTLSWGQAASPFATGATAFQTNLLTILTPVAIIGVMVLGVGAWFNRISWGWAVSGVLGIALFFGAPQLVTWIRGLFGV